MSLDKTARRREKVRAANRALRSLGTDFLSEPGPWFPVTPDFRFAPTFFPGLETAATPEDATRIGEPAGPLA